MHLSIEAPIKIRFFRSPYRTR